MAVAVVIDNVLAVCQYRTPGLPASLSMLGARRQNQMAEVSAHEHLCQDRGSSLSWYRGGIIKGHQRPRSF